MKLTNLKEKYKAFLKSLTDTEHDLFTHTLPNWYEIRYIEETEEL